MLHMKTAISIAAAAIIGMSACAIAAETAPGLSHAEKLKFNACIGTLKSDRESDPQCLAIMKRSKVPMADVEKMHDCEGTFKDIDKSTDCQSMIKKYPDLVYGHGELAPQTDAAMPTPPAK